MKAIGRLPRLSGDMRPAIMYCVTIAIGILLLVAIGPARVVGSYGTYVINLSLIYAIATLAVSMLSHSAGIFSVGHTAFLALGAYLAANMSSRGFTVEAIILAASLTSLVIGFVVGITAGRFSILYMAILTLALGLVANEVIGRWRSATGGDQGISVGPARLLFLDRPLKSVEVVMMTVVLATLIFLVTEIVTNGARGKRWLAIKSQRMAAMSIGMKPHVENALAFAFSGVLASVAGICLAFSTGYISPEAFVLEVSINLTLASVVGGTGSILGALMGGSFLVLVPELAREVQGISAYVFGTATIIVLLFLPGGIVPGVASLIQRLRKRPGRPGVDASGGLSCEGNEIRNLIGQLMSGAKETLAVEGLNVSFGGLKVLDDVNLSVAPGQVVGLIGPNGAGKTTLLNVLSGYVPPTSVRTLRLGDTDLAKLSAYERTAHGFGRTFQHAELFNELPIREIVLQAAHMGAAVGSKRKAHRDPVAVADQLIDALRLRRFAEAYPTEVPFGVQKVVDIARSLATGAQIVVMDEPFSGLDAAERAEVRSILQAMRAAGVSILIIDHVVDEVFDIADHVVVLDFGKVIAKGTPEEIQNDPKVLEAYLGSAMALREEEVQAHA